MCFSCYCLGEKCLSCTGRSDEKRALRQLRADRSELSGVVQEFNALLQALLRLILTGNVRKCDSGILLDVRFRLAFADAHHSAAFVHTVHEDAQ